MANHHTVHASRFTPMKILPPADENERQAVKLRMERALGQEQGGCAVSIAARSLVPLSARVLQDNGA
jgi:hypothetical protein